MITFLLFIILFSQLVSLLNMQFFLSLVAIPYFTGLSYHLSCFIILVRTSKLEVSVLVGHDKTMVSRGIASQVFLFSLTRVVEVLKEQARGWEVEDVVGSQVNGGLLTITAQKHLSEVAVDTDMVRRKMNTAVTFSVVRSSTILK